MKEDYTYRDQELFKRIAQGDEAAFREVFIYYNRELSPFVIKLTDSTELAKEVMQDIFFQLWKRREKLNSIQNPKAWIIRLASNTAINYLRKRAADGRIFERLSLHPGEMETPENALALKELAARIEQAVQRLPPAQQNVYRLSREQHLSIPDIAAASGLSPNTIKNQLVAALKSIRQQVDKGMMLVLFTVELFSKLFFNNQ